MNPLSLFILAGTAALLLGIGGCTQPAAAPTPTRVPAAAPTKAAEPTKAPAAPTTAPAAPTKAPEPTKPAAVPAKKVDFPEKGKSITFIMPYAAGGTGDLSARVLAPLMAQELATSIQVVNRPGAGGQTGTTELAKSKPDGYTLGYVVLPAIIGSYLDPERKAAFGRRDFDPIGNQYLVPVVLFVQTSSPYKTLKDLVDAAKAKPGEIKAGTGGIGNASDLGLQLFEKAANVKFATVRFDGGGPNNLALLGGHVDVASGTMVDPMPYHKSGQVRVLGIADREMSKFLPGVPTMESQGYKAYMYSAAALATPTGTPKEVMDILVPAMKKAMETDEHKRKMEEMGQTARYMPPPQFAAFWQDMESQIAPLIQPVK